jgi:hypothetical protein
MYRTISIINALLCVVDIYLMIQLVKQYELPKVFTLFYYYMFVCVILMLAGQVYTIISPPKQYWILKLSVTVFVMMILSFFKGIKHFSHKK